MIMFQAGKTFRTASFALLAIRACGLTQKELAARVKGGLDYTYIGKIERGEQLPSLKILMKISEALSVPVGSFFQEESSPLVCGIPCSKLKLLAEEVKGCELVDALKLLNKGDIPLVVEIARMLSRHRSAAKGQRSDDVWAAALMAAKERTSHGKK